MFEVRVVCEGPTDFPVVAAALDAHLQREYLLKQIQPESSLYGGAAGLYGGGWKGVRGWCRSVKEAGGFEAVRALPKHGLLVIHVDADIAGDAEIDVDQPCPPPMATVKALKRVVLDWLGLNEIPERVVLCIPSKSTEAWLLRAFFPDDPAAVSCSLVGPQDACVECIPDPAHDLLNRTPRFVRMKDKVLKKNRKEYEACQNRLSKVWHDVVANCASAEWFDQQLRRALR